MTQTEERANTQDSSETPGEMAKKETSMIAVNEMCRQQEKSAVSWRCVYMHILTYLYSSSIT